MEDIMATLEPIIQTITGLFTGGGEGAEGFDFSTNIDTIMTFISGFMGE